MPVKTIRINDYRNYRRKYLEFDPHLNIIVGKNGSGKTNILESIIVVSNTKSYRTNNDADLIRKGCDFARIVLNTEDKEYKVVINKKNKSLYIDNELIKRTSEFIGKVNAILFKPSDLELFTQSPSERRKLLDIEIAKVSKSYIHSLSRYNSLLKDKNKLLKQLEADQLLLNVLNESMTPMIKIIISERENFFTIINRYISEYYHLISDTDSKIEIVYKKCCEIADVEIVVDGTSGTHTDDGLHAVEVVKLVGIDADRGHTHTVTHHADTLSLVGAGITQHATNIIKLHCIVEELLGHQFHTQRIARHDYCLGNVAKFCPDVGSWSITHTLVGY